MSEGNTRREQAYAFFRPAWWTLNVCLVSLFFGVWLVITMLGSMSASASSMGALQFLLPAQWVPLSYLALVVVYGVVMNRCAAKYAVQATSQDDSEPNEAKASAMSQQV